jgi:hypothetical protein
MTLLGANRYSAGCLPILNMCNLLKTYRLPEYRVNQIRHHPRHRDVIICHFLSPSGLTKAELIETPSRIRYGSEWIRKLGGWYAMTKVN